MCSIELRGTGLLDYNSLWVCTAGDYFTLTKYTSLINKNNLNKKRCNYYLEFMNVKQ